MTEGSMVVSVCSQKIKEQGKTLLLTEVFPCIVVTEWEIISPKPVSSLQ